MILGIDPGTHKSGYVLFDDGKVITSGVMENFDLLKIIRDSNADQLAIEKFVAYGSAVGQECFDTCVWIGRFVEAWAAPDEVLLIPRRDVKRHVCGKGQWDDGDVREKLIALLGDPGSKKAPGPTYGVTSHAWQALGVAVTAANT